MVKHPAYRLRKYESGIDPDKIASNLEAQKPAMVEQQGKYFADIALIEQKAKDIVEEAGVSSFEVAQYLNVARQCYSKAQKFMGTTLTREAQYIVDHWSSRGLNPILVSRVCNISGCGTQAGLPDGIIEGCTLGNLLVCGPDGWQELTPGAVSTFLHSQGPGVIPNWQAGITDHGALAGLGDDDHTQYVLRSILTQHGDLFYRDGAGIQRLAPGVAGRILSTQGVGAPPQWIASPGGDPRVPRTIFEHPHRDGSNNWPPAIGGGVTAEVFIRIPPNWNGLDTFNIWILPNFTDTQDIDVTIDIGTGNEAFNTHTQTVNNTMVAFVANQYEIIDFTAIFATVLANLAPNDMMWIKISSGQEVDIILCIGAEVIET